MSVRLYLVAGGGPLQVDCAGTCTDARATEARTGTGTGTGTRTRTEARASSGACSDGGPRNSNDAPTLRRLENALVTWTHTCDDVGGWRLIAQPSSALKRTPEVQPIQWDAPPPSTGSPPWVDTAMGDDPEPTMMGSLDEYGGHACLTQVLRNDRGNTSEQRCTGPCGPVDVSSWKDVALYWLDYANRDATRAVNAHQKMSRLNELREAYEALPSGVLAVATGRGGETVDDAIRIAEEVRCIIAVGTEKLQEQGKPPPPPPKPEPAPDGGGWTWPFEWPSPAAAIPWWAWVAGGGVLLLLVAKSPQARAYREYRRRSD